MPSSTEAQPIANDTQAYHNSMPHAHSDGKPGAMVTHHVHAHFQIDSEQDAAHQTKARIHGDAGQAIARRGEMGEQELEAAVDKAKAEIEAMRGEILKKEGEVMRGNETLQIKEYQLGVLEGALRAQCVQFCAV